MDSPDLLKRVVGDDLGSDNFLLTQGRLEFTNIPYLKKIGLRTFVYGELAFYPPFNSTLSGFHYLTKNTRFSAGYGLAIPLNPMLNIMIYYNALNFHSLKGGDYERRNLINVNLGFF